MENPCLRVGWGTAYNFHPPEPATHSPALRQESQLRFLMHKERERERENESQETKERSRVVKGTFIPNRTVRI